MRGIPATQKSLFRSLLSKTGADAISGLTEKEMLQAMTFIKNDLVRKNAGITPTSMTDEAFTKANIPLERRLVSQDLKALYRFANESDFARAILDRKVSQSRSEDSYLFLLVVYPLSVLQEQVVLLERTLLWVIQSL